MLRSVGYVSRTFEISPSLLRYAERQGFIPHAERIDGDGARIYSETHMEAIRQWRAKAGRRKMEDAN